MTSRDCALAVVQVVLLLLKITGISMVATWSWPQVLLPAIIWVLALVVVMGFTGIGNEED